LVWQICFLNWGLDINSCDGPVTKDLLLMLGPEFKSMVWSLLFFMMTSFGA
jgi:hypothetical protein